MKTIEIWKNLVWHGWREQDKMTYSKVIPAAPKKWQEVIGILNKKAMELTSKEANKKKTILEPKNKKGSDSLPDDG
jgi:hypothetical protein